MQGQNAVTLTMLRVCFVLMQILISSPNVCYAMLVDIKVSNVVNIESVMVDYAPQRLSSA